MHRAKNCNIFLAIWLSVTGHGFLILFDKYIYLNINSHNIALLALPLCKLHLFKDILARVDLILKGYSCLFFFLSPYISL